MVGTDQNQYIFCNDLFKIYKIADLEVVALRGLDLSIRRSEVVAIVGASGSGKSTLLNLLAGFETPSAGGISVGGMDLLRMTSNELENYRRKEVGFIWQQTSRNLFPYLTSLENVVLPMMLTDVSLRERTKRAEKLLNLTGMENRMNHTPEKLSGGEQQRVAIAVGLANNPTVLLADEPTGELDDATAAEILDLFGTINRELETTIVIVTHDPDIAYKVGRVVIIRDGKTSTEIRRKITSQKISGSAAKQQPLEEFTLVDNSGRVQIPGEFLEKLRIKEKIRVQLEKDKVTLMPEE